MCAAPGGSGHTVAVKPKRDYVGQLQKEAEKEEYPGWANKVGDNADQGGRLLIRPVLPRSRVVVCAERRGRVEECRGAHEAAAHAVAADRRRQPGLLLYLRGPPPISPWSSVEAKSSTAQAKVAWYRSGPSTLPSTPVAAVTKTNRS